MATTLRARGIRFLAVVVPTAFLMGAPASSAQAALLLIDGTGKLTGATGVTVGGSSYDVEFVDSNCVTLFDGCDADTDFAFSSLEAAFVAAQALQDQVFLDGPQGDFDSNPALTRGCSTDCYALVPWALSNISGFVQVVVLWNAAGLGTSIQGPGNFSRLQSTEPLSGFVWVRLRAASVPEPATLTLLGLGCAGLGLARRRRRG